jgi:hypothetical protein
MTVLQIHEEMAFAVMSFCPCLIGTKSLFESLDLTPKAVKALQLSPFEPLDLISFKFLTYKCCFLLA